MSVSRAMSADPQGISVSKVLAEPATHRESNDASSERTQTPPSARLVHVCLHGGIQTVFEYRNRRTGGIYRKT